MCRYSDYELNPYGFACVNFKDKSKFIELPCKAFPVIRYDDSSDVFCYFCGENLSGKYFDGDGSPEVITCFGCGAWLDNTKSITKEEAEQALKEREENAVD